MNERLFKSIKRTGSGTLATGIVVLCVGVATGVFLIVSGARLLLAKADTLF